MAVLSEAFKLVHSVIELLCPDNQQLVLSGDFFQLPPVPQRNKKGEQIQPKFAFEADTWDSCVGPPVTLNRVFRQKNQGYSFHCDCRVPLSHLPTAFVNMLNAMRFGQMDHAVIAAFKQLSRPVTYDDGIEPTELLGNLRL